MKISINTASIQDINTIQHLAKVIWPYTYGSLLSKDQFDYMMNMMYSTSALTNQMTELGHSFFLLVVDQDPIGFMSVQQNYEPNKTKVHKLYILPSYHGKGLGKILINKAKEFAASNHNSGIMLQVKRDNPAVDFYKKLGLVIVKEFKFEIGNGYYMDDYIMESVME